MGGSTACSTTIDAYIFRCIIVKLPSIRRPTRAASVRGHILAVLSIIPSAAGCLSATATRSTVNTFSSRLCKFFFRYRVHVSDLRRGPLCRRYIPERGLTSSTHGPIRRSSNAWGAALIMDDLTRDNINRRPVDLSASAWSPLLSSFSAIGLCV